MRYGDELRWGTDDKSVLLNMAIDDLRAQQGETSLDVQVRSLCHSRGVTADYLKFTERFNMKPCILVLGNLGKSPIPWAELIQPAVYLHMHEHNIIWMEVPPGAVAEVWPAPCPRCTSDTVREERRCTRAR